VQGIKTGRSSGFYLLTWNAAQREREIRRSRSDKIDRAQSADPPASNLIICRMSAP
jgi:hypothetical protein